LFLIKKLLHIINASLTNVSGTIVSITLFYDVLTKILNMVSGSFSLRIEG
jgi:hypothetical protein